MTNVTKVVRPFFERFINRSTIETTVLSGAIFNVMPRTGQVNIENCFYVKFYIKKIDGTSTQWS
jgi:hypothetical protein